VDGRAGLLSTIAVVGALIGFPKIAIWAVLPDFQSVSSDSDGAPLPGLPKRRESDVRADVEAFVATHGISDLQDDLSLAVRELPEVIYYGDVLESRSVDFNLVVSKHIIIPADAQFVDGQDRREFTDQAAHLFLEEECAVLLEVIAKECMVVNAHSTERSDSMNMSGRIAFVAKNDQGDLSGITGSMLHHARYDSKEKDVPQPSRERLKSERRKIYAGVLGACEKLKKKTGNCSIDGISIVHYKKDDGNTRVGGSGTFKTLLSTTPKSL
jgi:hypothetical protein